MSEEKLKPCPRCGDVVRLVHHRGCKYIKCNCGIQSERYHELYSDNVIITRWNSRHTDDALRKRVQELEAENKKMRKYICFGCQMKDHETTCETCNFAEKKGGGE